MKRTMWWTAAGVLAALAPAAAAQSPRAVTIAAHFEAFAGSRDNALALVESLRHGSAVRLAAPAPAAENALPAFTLIEPAAGAMEWPDVESALAVAQDTLARAGITRPTAEQLEAVLVGGELSNARGEQLTVPGVLPLRAAGIDWGRVAELAGPHPTSGL
jgi:hypothetical protein